MILPRQQEEPTLLQPPLQLLAERAPPAGSHALTSDPAADQDGGTPVLPISLSVHSLGEEDGGVGAEQATEGGDGLTQLIPFRGGRRRLLQETLDKGQASGEQ